MSETYVRSTETASYVRSAERASYVRSADRGPRMPHALLLDDDPAALAGS